MKSGTVLQNNFRLAEEAMRKKISTYARNCHIPGMDKEDLEQELLCDLYKAVETYDPLRGARFNTFAQTLFQNRISKLKRAASAMKRIPATEVVSIDQEDLELATHEQQADWLDKSAVGDLVTSLHLSAEAAEVVAMLALGVGTKEIAVSIGQSVARVEEIVEELSYNWDLFRGLKKLRKAV